MLFLEEVLTDAGIDPAPDLETPIVGAVRAAVCAAATRLGFRVLGAHAARVLNQPFGAEGAAAPAVCAASVITTLGRLLETVRPRAEASDRWVRSYCSENACSRLHEFVLFCFSFKNGVEDPA